MSNDWVAELNRTLADYETKAVRIAEEEIKAAAQDAAKELRETEHLFKTHHRGYAKSWGVENDGYVGAPSYVVRNKKHYRLTHLLENGHVKVVHGKRGGRVRPIKHIAPVAEKYSRILPERIERRLKG